MNTRLHNIKSKIEELSLLDKKHQIFGSSSHQYQKNRVISLLELNEFESKYKIKLPEEYSQFLTQIENGGLGPYYGLISLKDSLFTDLDYPNIESLINPSEPFVHNENWNLNFTGDEDNEDEYEKWLEFNYYDDKLLNGTITICNYGCGIKILLVVNGKEKGNIWVDDRIHGNGIFAFDYFKNQDKFTFFDWFETWLDHSLHEIKEFVKNNPKTETKKKFNWKFW